MIPLEVQHSAKLKVINIPPLFLCPVQSCTLIRHNQFHMIRMTFTHAHTHTQPTTFAHLWKIINFPLIKSCFRAIGGPFTFLAAGESTIVESVLFEPTGHIPVSVFLHDSQRSYINEKGGFVSHLQRAVGHVRHSLVCFWRVLASGSYCLAFFFLLISH